MGDQIARAEKNKNVVGSSSSEYPEDIPQGCKRRLSWRNVEGKNMLRQVVDQGNQPYCWNISTSHMVSSHLYIHGKTETLLPLSARHLFVGVKGKNPDGSLKNFENLKDFLVNQGMIQEKDCACVVEKENKQIGSSSKSKPKDKKKSSKKENAKANPCFGKMKGKKVTKIRNLQIVRNVDERELIELLQRGPVTVSIEVATTFKLFKGDEVLRGYSQSKSLEDHMIELTGYDTTPDGINYWEFQNSYGLGWGQNGFGKLIRKSSRKKHEPSLINAYIYPELLD
ncbi:Peptidase C1A papain C-terminal [Arabidopsis thaliana x Arabidopsis arenosa]|uniref:Peptidase C1A papain C-terminal n=1 Tax=Arabidopsis thaliana x Arabidopsis arenosa TaxID=1240361 RepID=A0A8T2BM19_9BRAS|nr:Peptidase C1A papain C-terminal [Arabidopsis thaliana x Arabidopsis arenosa]